MKRYVLLTILIILVFALTVFIFKGIREGNGAVYSGKSINWESHADLSENESDIYLNYVGQENYTGDVQYSYTISTLDVKINTHYTNGKRLHDKVTRPVNLKEVNEIRVTVKWDGKAESFKLHKKNP